MSVPLLSMLDELPPALLGAAAHELHEVLPGPTLLHLPGRRARPLFVSVLLHGNETTGWEAVRTVLKRHAGRELPRALSVLIGNVDAAREGVRRLSGQPDYNRIWPGVDPADSPEARVLATVVETMAAREVFASIDLHNNSGLNPHYACVNRLEHRFLQLARLFGRTVVFFTQPRGVQSIAFAELCPATTIECGQAGQDPGVDHAVEYLEACLHLAELPDHPIPAQDLDLFHTVARVTVPASVSFSFTEPGVDIRFNDDLDHLNFRELPAGTTLGLIRPGSGVPLTAIDYRGVEVTDTYLDNIAGRLTFTRPVMPSMLTLDERIIRQDCVCYLMERITPAWRDD